jgi:hypothetical protein
LSTFQRFRSLKFSGFFTQAWTFREIFSSISTFTYCTLQSKTCREQLRKRIFFKNLLW